DRAYAAMALGEMGKEARPALGLLIDALRPEPAGVPYAAADAIGKIGDPERAALPRLLEALKNPRATLPVALALWKVEKHPDALKTWTALLRDDDIYLRRGAAQALGEIGLEAAPAIPALRAALKDEWFEVRRAAAAALGGLGPAARAAVPE